VNKHISEGRPLANRDIVVADSILNLFPELRPALHYRDLEQVFVDLDRMARRRKVTFTTLGTTSLILVCAVLVMLAWRLSLAIISFDFPVWVDDVLAVMGLLAVVIQLYLFLSGLHSKWIFARFMAERIRQWKFQTLLDGQLISKLVKESSAQFSSELKQRWALFKEEFKHGIGGMNEFMKSSPPELVVAPKSYLDNDLLNKVRKAFILLRLDVQTSHYEDKNARLEPLDSLTDSWARVLIGVSGLVAVIEACLVAVHMSNWIGISEAKYRPTTAILAGLAMSFAITSAGIRLYRGASMMVEERERYHAKQSHLKRIRGKIAEQSDPHKILSLMEEAEMVCTEELQDFIRSLRRANYFF
jgi:hypothetical protein